MKCDKCGTADGVKERFCHFCPTIGEGHAKEQVSKHGNLCEECLQAVEMADNETAKERGFFARLLFVVLGENQDSLAIFDSAFVSCLTDAEAAFQMTHYIMYCNNHCGDGGYTDALDLALVINQDHAQNHVHQRVFQVLGRVLSERGW